MIMIVYDLPAVALSPSSAICLGDSTVLDADGADTYSWTPNDAVSATTGETITVNPIITTTYNVLGTDTTTGCENNQNTTITVNPLPNVSAGTDQTVCNQPIPINLTGTPTSGNWSGPNITSDGIFTPAETGTFTVTHSYTCLLYTSPSPRDATLSRMPSSA